MKRSISILSVIAAISSIISACFGVFYTNGGMQRTVENIYGQKITLFGDGIYANNSLLKAGATKGTDIAVILTALLLLALIFASKNKKTAAFLKTGLLSIILYASACLIMGVTFNRLFPLYLVQFGSSLFAFILSMDYIIHTDNFDGKVYEKTLTGTGVFLIIGGCSVLMWLMFILPAVITGKPMENIEIYTTEPTFVFDLAIILPTSLFCGIMLLKKRAIGYKIAPVLLTLLSGVGVCVIFQTIVQLSLGIVLSTGQVIGLVGSFVILGAFATVLNIRLLRYAK